MPRISQLTSLDFYCCNAVTDADLALLSQLQNLRRLQLSCGEDDDEPNGLTGNITDAGIASIQHLANLEELELEGWELLTGQALVYIGCLTQLRCLNMNCAGIFDDPDSMRHIACLKKLRRIFLFTYGKELTDGSLGHLCGLPLLDTLWLRNCAVTELAVERLVETCPELRDIDMAKCPSITREYRLSLVARGKYSRLWDV